LSCIYIIFLAAVDSSAFDEVKTVPKIYDQQPTVVFNVKATLNKTQLKHHVKGASFVGKFSGPGFVAFGHNLDEGWGIGPDLPGCCGIFCWACCFCGTWPCSPMTGHGVNKFKSDFNAGMAPKPGQGMA